jgi:hypothetical protein
MAQLLLYIELHDSFASAIGGGGGMKPHCVRIGTARENFIMILDYLQLLTMRNFSFPAILITLLLMTSCRSSLVEREGPADTSDYQVIDSVHVPVLATPAEQLAYARSTFEIAGEKAAALKAVKVIHPMARLHAGIAALELAYLRLGDDYRLADARQAGLAEGEFLAILAEFADLPEIAAKALWYLGWISCDLRKDNSQGIDYYLQLVRTYPAEKMSLLPPAPWLTIRLTGAEKDHQPFYPRSKLAWADIARLEIIRHTADHDQAWAAMRAIKENAPDALFLGTALKVLLTGHGLTPVSEQLAMEYLANPQADTHLKSDLALALSAHKRER